MTAVPARHYIPGDTRYFPELVDVATRFPHFDAALLTVGGERPPARHDGPHDEDFGV